MTLQELINRDFNGNVSAFAKAYDTTRATTYRLLKVLSKPQEKLRNRLLRKGVHFGDENQSQNQMKTLEQLKQDNFTGTRYIPECGFQYYDDFNGDFDFTETFASEQAAIDFLKKWDIDNYFNWPTDEKITLFVSKAKFENGEFVESAPFGKFSKTFTIHSPKYYILDDDNEKVLERLYKGAPCQWVQISFAEDREMPDDYLFPEKDAAELIKEYGGEMFKYSPQEPDYAGPNFDK